MKKRFVSCLALLAAIPIAFVGCGFTPLKNAPTSTAEMKITGSALKYDNYVYFANSFLSYNSMKDAKDFNGIYRVSLDNNQVTFNEETGFAENVEQVNSKVVASENTFMYSVGEYIYFGAPSTAVDENDTKVTLSQYNQYFRIKTDGTGLKKFYSTNSTITQQTVWTVGDKHYLILVDAKDKKDGDETKTVKTLVKIDLDTLKATTILEDFTSIVFSDKYDGINGNGFAYFLRAADADLNQVGSELYRVNVLESDEPVLLNAGQTRTMSLVKVVNGKLFLSITDLAGAGTELNPSYYSLAYSTTQPFAPTKVFGPYDSSDVASFNVVKAEDNKEYVIVSTTSSGKTYVLKEGSTALNNELVNDKITFVCSEGDYVYFTYSTDGLHRIDVRGESPQVETVISTKDFKTTNIAFDGIYMYYYALNKDLTTGDSYFLHRVKLGAGNVSPELLSYVPSDQVAEKSAE